MSYWMKLFLAGGESAAPEGPSMFDPDDPPTTIGPWTLLRELGRGGMGVVFLAKHNKYGNFATLKFLLELQAEDTRDRVVREATLLAKLQHPNIAAFHSCEDRHLPPYIVMEFIDGWTLGDEPTWDLEYRDIVEIAAQVCRALVLAHEKGIIHCDLKPSNVMVTGTFWTAKVLDFGIARLFGQIHFVQDRSQRGAAEFLAPEIFARAELTPAVDLYALACCIGYMFGGEPVGVEAAERAAWIRRSTQTRGSGRLKSALARSLDPIPTARPSAKQLLQVLDEELARLRRGSKYRWIAIWILTATIMVGITSWLLIPGTIRSVEPRPEHLRVTYNWGRARMIPPPAGAGPFNGARLVRPRSGAAPWIVAWTKPLADGSGELFFWSRSLQMEHRSSAVEMSPYIDGDDSRHDIEQIIQVRELGQTRSGGTRLGSIEASSLFTSSVRIFEFAETSTGLTVEERSRLYHEGHISDVAFTDSPRGSLLWLTGTVRGGGTIRQEVDGQIGATKFLAAFPWTEATCGVFAPTEPIAPRFHTEFPECDLLDSFLYFAIRSFQIQGDGIDWRDGPTPTFDRVETYRNDPARATFVLSTTLQADVRWRSTLDLTCDWSMTDMLVNQVLERRGKATGVGADMGSFLADSVVVLVRGEEGLSIEGNFQDER